MKTLLGLVRIYTLPQGATNSVAHMQNAMNQILKDFVPEKTIPFVNDIPIKGCEEAKRDSTVEDNGCKAFVDEHIKDVDRILSRLEEVDMTSSYEKSKFGPMRFWWLIINIDGMEENLTLRKWML